MGGGLIFLDQLSAFSPALHCPSRGHGAQQQLVASDFGAIIHDVTPTSFMSCSVLMENFEELLPIVSTPTVREACQRYGLMFKSLPRGLFVTLEDRGRVFR